MPIMSNLEQNQILEHANFLFMMGYKLINQDAHGFVFANNKFQFIIFYERRQDASDITIRFMKENETFSIGWLSFIDDKNKCVDIQQKLDNIVYLLEFIKQNYNQVTDISFCRTTMKEAEMKFHNKD